MTQPANRTRATTPRPVHPRALAGAETPAGTNPLVAKKGEDRHHANRNSARSATGWARREVPASAGAPGPRPLAKA